MSRPGGVPLGRDDLDLMPHFSQLAGKIGHRDLGSTH
jgi:hypothetical protein